MKTQNKFYDIVKRSGLCIFVIVIICSVFSGCKGNDIDAADYSKEENWAYYEKDKSGTSADVFFVCPTVYFGDENNFNMPLSDESARTSFLGATNMEKGIYDKNSRFFAPYYRQIAMNVYEMSAKEQEAYLSIAYADVKASFEYYMDNENGGRPIILAGFSQGADMCIRLLKDCFRNDDTNDLLVACYAIGWRITDKELRDNPHLKFAKGESDTGVIVSFNCESDTVTDSLMIPKGTKALAINPLNWKTDSTYAHRQKNLGACFTDYDGEIKNEIRGLTGAYIDSARGALKVTDVSQQDYPAGLDIFEDGVYHLYDYQFFYRNLQKNVSVRLSAYLSANR